MGLGTIVSNSYVRIVELDGGEPDTWATGDIRSLDTETEIPPGSLLSITYTNSNTYSIASDTILTPGSGTVQSQGSGTTAAVINIASIGDYVLYGENSAPETLPLWNDPSSWKTGSDNTYTSGSTTVSTGPQPPAPPIIFAFIYDPTGVMVAVDFLSESGE